MARRVTPEMVGATQGPIALTGQQETARMAVSAPTGPAAAALSSGTPPQIYLNIENITGAGAPTVYEVYLNVPDGEAPEQHPELFAGLLPMFGVTETSKPTRGHSGSGLHYTLDVGDIVQVLEAANAWDSNELRVTFVPAQVGDEAEVAGASAAAVPDPIQVGRVSLYYS